MDHMEQGLAIRTARLGRNLTQAHLAAASGVSEKTIRRAESGEAIRADNARAICSVLGLDAANLRSEAEMRPDVAEAFRVESRRQAWVSRIAVGAMALGCLVFPLLALFLGDGGYQVVYRAFTLFLIALSPLAIGFVLGTLPATRSMLAGIPGVPAVQAFVRLRLVLIMATVIGVAAPATLGLAAFAIHKAYEAPTNNAVANAGVLLLLAAYATRVAVRMVVFGRMRKEAEDNGPHLASVGETATQAT